MNVLRGLLLLLCAPGLAYGQVRLDTLETRAVGPGVSYAHVVATAVPWSINLLKVDLSQPALEVETALAFDRYAAGRERTSIMAAHRSRPGHRVLGAINADFFNLDTGAPVGLQVAGGEIVNEEYARPVAVFDSANGIRIDQMKVGGEVRAGRAAYPFSGANETREEDELLLFNGYAGRRTPPSDAGVEVLARPLDPWLFNAALRLVVEDLPRGGGGHAIPIGLVVLSGAGRAATFLQEHAAIHDTLRLVQTLVGTSLQTDAGQIEDAQIEDVLGGHPVLVRNGTVVDPGTADFSTTRHPRTAFGYAADGHTAFLITVDGRGSSSAGMSLAELADFMLRLGIRDGINFDGGGSTTMVVDGQVVNSPSDATGERAVANALLIVSTALP